LLQVSLDTFLDLYFATDLPLGAQLFLGHDFDHLLDFLSLVNVLEVLILQVTEIIHELIRVSIENVFLIEVLAYVDQFFAQQLLEPSLPVLLSHRLRRLALGLSAASRSSALLPSVLRQLRQQELIFHAAQG